ncbi:aldehyde dehydrogenase family protein [Sphingomonas sp.]|uniref:aldehyde dehydrogenase family protein n=1 Tax=Sphingomonas sp. TaxID=28214 RepID=UPI0031E3BBE3
MDAVLDCAGGGHNGLDLSAQLLIGGELVDGAERLDVIDPASGQAFRSASRASAEQAEAAVAAAKRAFPEWAATKHTERQAKVLALAGAIATHRDALAELLTREQGKPLAEAAGEVAWAEGYLRHYATMSLPERVIQDDGSARVIVRHVPLGVVVGIIAWNFPVLLAAWKIGLSVLAGNAIVLKPAPTTPLTALAIGALCRDIFPAGVVNVIADDNDLGPFLSAHPDVAKISFTGSTPTGSRIMASAAQSLKRLTLELGGNDPAIVLGDVNVKQTAQAIFGSAFLNCGQVCLAIKRVYVPAELHDAICAELLALAEAATVGPGMEGHGIGPLQNRAQFEKVKAFLDRARADGLDVAGGAVLEREGYFIAPAIVRGAKDGDQIVDEEQFGPVLPVVPYTSVDDVVAAVNASPQGLGASIWSADLDAATRVAERVQAGSVWVNQHLAIGPHLPMAGFRQSGIGVEQAEDGLKEMTQIQVINIAR